MGTFIIIVIVIIGIVIFFVVQLTDTSDAEVFNYNYKGSSFMGSPHLLIGPNRSTISIQKKFITIEDQSKNRSKEKVRILRTNVSPDYIQYICMDGLRNQLEILRPRQSSGMWDAILVSYYETTDIYTNNPNYEEDLKKQMHS